MAGLLSRLLGGVDKFSGEVLNPTSSLGKLGAYLGAASGGTLGQAALGYQSQQRQNEQQSLQTQLAQMRLMSTLAKPNTTNLQQELESAGIQAGTPEYKSAVLNATSRGLPTGYQFNAQGVAAPIGGVLTPQELQEAADKRAQASQAAIEARFMAGQAASDRRQAAMFEHQDSNRASKYEYRTGPNGQIQRRRIN